MKTAIVPSIQHGTLEKALEDLTKEYLSKKDDDSFSFFSKLEEHRQTDKGGTIFLTSLKIFQAQLEKTPGLNQLPIKEKKIKVIDFCAKYGKYLQHEHKQLVAVLLEEKNFHEIFMITDQSGEFFLYGAFAEVIKALPSHHEVITSCIEANFDRIFNGRIPIEAAAKLGAALPTPRHKFKIWDIFFKQVRGQYNVSCENDPGQKKQLDLLQRFFKLYQKNQKQEWMSFFLNMFLRHFDWDSIIRPDLRLEVLTALIKLFPNDHEALAKLFQQIFVKTAPELPRFNINPSKAFFHFATLLQNQDETLFEIFKENIENIAKHSSLALISANKVMPTKQSQLLAMLLERIDNFLESTCNPEQQFRRLAETLNQEHHEALADLIGRKFKDIFNPLSNEKEEIDPLSFYKIASGFFAPMMQSEKMAPRADLLTFPKIEGLVNIAKFMPTQRAKLHDIIMLNREYLLDEVQNRMTAWANIMGSLNFNPKQNIDFLVNNIEYFFYDKSELQEGSNGDGIKESSRAEAFAAVANAFPTQHKSLVNCFKQHHGRILNEKTYADDFATIARALPSEQNTLLQYFDVGLMLAKETTPPKALRMISKALPNYRDYLINILSAQFKTIFTESLSSISIPLFSRLSSVFPHLEQQKSLVDIFLSNTDYFFPDGSYKKATLFVEISDSFPDCKKILFDSLIMKENGYQNFISPSNKFNDFLLIARSINDIIEAKTLMKLFFNILKFCTNEESEDISVDAFYESIERVYVALNWDEKIKELKKAFEESDLVEPDRSGAAHITPAKLLANVHERMDQTESPELSLEEYSSDEDPVAVYLNRQGAVV